METPRTDTLGVERGKVSPGVFRLDAKQNLHTAKSANKVNGTTQKDMKRFDLSSTD